MREKGGSPVSFESREKEQGSFLEINVGALIGIEIREYASMHLKSSWERMKSHIGNRRLFI